MRANIFPKMRQLGQILHIQIFETNEDILLSWRRVQGSNLLVIAHTSFQDSRITVLPTLHNVNKMSLEWNSNP